MIKVWELVRDDVTLPQACTTLGSLPSSLCCLAMTVQPVQTTCGKGPPESLHTRPLTTPYQINVVWNLNKSKNGGSLMRVASKRKKRSKLKFTRSIFNQLTPHPPPTQYHSILVMWVTYDLTQSPGRSEKPPVSESWQARMKATNLSYTHTHTHTGKSYWPTD